MHYAWAVRLQLNVHSQAAERDDGATLLCNHVTLAVLHKTASSQTL